MTELLKNTGFETATPEQCGFTSASVLNLLDTVRQRKINLHSLMILRHGKAAVGLWWKPYRPELPHQLYSFSKSVVSAAVGIAIGEGRLSLDDRIAEFFPRKIGADADDRIFSVTVEHLLAMTSGACSQNEVTMRGKTEWTEWFLNTPLDYEPGERFTYNSLNSYMLAVILCRVTGMGLVDYLMPRLFEPLGIERPVWDLSPEGVECGGWGLYLTTADMAKFCQLFLDDGVWHEKRILPKRWTKLVGERHAESSDDLKLDDSPHRTMGYGYHFWRNGDGASFRADGMFGQYGIILPQKDMVIAVTGGHSSQIEIMHALWDSFVPFVDDIPEGSQPGKDYDELCKTADTLCLYRPHQRIRNIAMERIVSGRKWVFPLNHHSLVPLSVRYLHRIRTLGVSELRFDFGEDMSTLLWKENGEEHIIPFLPDGQFCSGELNYSRRRYPIVTAAGWTGANELEVNVRLITTAHMQRIIFRFEDDTVSCIFDEDPSMESLLKMAFDFSKPMRPVAQRMARAVRRIIPGVRGKAE